VTCGPLKFGDLDPEFSIKIGDPDPEMAWWGGQNTSRNHQTLAFLWRPGVLAWHDFPSKACVFFSVFYVDFFRPRFLKARASSKGYPTTLSGQGLEARL